MKNIKTKLLEIAEPNSEENDDGQLKAIFYLDDLIELFKKEIKT